MTEPAKPHVAKGSGSAPAPAPLRSVPSPTDPKPAAAALGAAAANITQGARPAQSAPGPQRGPSPAGPSPAAPSPAAPSPIAPSPTVMRPVAGAAQLKWRHYALMLSFVALVILPGLVSAFYLFVLANDQYASRAGFTIRQDDGNSASAILGGLSLLAGATQGVNAGVLHEFMQSQTLMESVDARVDLRAHYAQGWPGDPVYSIWPDATTEELFGFWQRTLRLSYDSSSGLIDVTVKALDPVTAQKIMQVILEESQVMINRLNEASRRDALSHADRDLEEAVADLRIARGALTVFRAENRIIDPIADLEGRLGVVSNLQQQLAQSLVELDLLDPSTSVDDPRYRQLTRRIDVIRARIEAERNFFGIDSDFASSDTYPEMMAKYEALSVDLEFAQRTYTAALAAKQAAVSNANRQSLYLAAYVPPTLAQEAEYPQRFTLLAMIFGFLMLAWATLALIYYSLRDRA